MAGDTVTDGHDELFEVLEGAPSDAVVGEIAKEAFDHVQARRRSKREMRVQLFSTL